jgi:hypothetical protein
MHVEERPLTYIAARGSDAKTITNVPPTGHNVNASTVHTDYSPRDTGSNSARSVCPRFLTLPHPTTPTAHTKRLNL